MQPTAKQTPGAQQTLYTSTQQQIGQIGQPLPSQGMQMTNMPVHQMQGTYIHTTVHVLSL